VVILRSGLALVLVAFFLFACGGAGAFPKPSRPVLEAPDTMVIMALEPHFRHPPDQAGGDLFHGYVVTGKAPVEDEASRRALMDLVFEGVSKSDGKVARCFNPRHAIRVTRAGEVVDLVICYECFQISVLRPGTEDGPMVLTDDKIGARVDDFFAARAVKPLGR